jgi:mRNA-degrading endonuclease RelE of RelBE toxin-antitoxin system
MDVKFERPAEEALAYIMRDDEDLGYKVLARLKKLKIDPYPHSFGDVTINSETVQFLKDQGFDVRKLRCSEFDKYRVFYFVDEKVELVVICEIIKRTDDTYNEKALHIIRIQEAYRKHYKLISGNRR